MRRFACIAAAPGAAIVAVDTALALALGNTSLFVPLLVIGPLAAAALASPRCTLGVALLAVACAIPLGLGDNSLLSAEHIGEMAVVAAGGALAVLAAAGRRRYEEALVTERAARRRSDFVARAGELLEAPPEPEAMLREIVRMAVPTWPSCASSTSCTTASSARRPPTRPIRARSRCCSRRARAIRSTPAGRTPSRSRRARAARTCSTRSGPSGCAPSPSTTSTCGSCWAPGTPPRWRCRCGPRADDRGAQLHALRRRAALRRHRRRAGERGRAPRRAGPRQRAPVRRAAPNRGPTRGGARQPRRRRDGAGARRERSSTSTRPPPR